MYIIALRLHAKAAHPRCRRGSRISVTPEDQTVAVPSADARVRAPSSNADVGTLPGARTVSDAEALVIQRPRPPGAVSATEEPSSLNRAIPRARRGRACCTASCTTCILTWVTFRP
jgi:hypothetical protein